MAFNRDLRELTQPGSIGNQTIALTANFDPKVIILWGSPMTASGTAATVQFCMGFGTYRGAAVQQRCVAMVVVDAATNGDANSEMANDALFLGIDFGGSPTTPPTRDLEIDLVSMQTGATSEVVINWANLHATASVKIWCLILGGSDISDALVFNFTDTTAVATQDVTVTTGFGQPDFLMILGNAHTAFAANAFCSMSLGFGKKGEAGRQLTFGSRNNNTVMFVAMSQRSNLICRDVDANVNPAVIEAAYSLNTDPATNWPTDGFQIDYETQATVADIQCCLAIKGTFTSTTGNGTAPDGTPPVTQNLAHGSAPKLAWVMGWNLAAATTIDEASADLGAFSIGCGDGTVELCAGGCDDDGLGTSDSNKFQSNAKVIQNYNNAAAIQSEADGSISGNNFVLSWSDTDTVAREYQWFTLGDAAAAETITVDKWVPEAPPRHYDEIEMVPYQ